MVFKTKKNNTGEGRKRERKRERERERERDYDCFFFNVVGVTLCRNSQSEGI